MDRMAREQLLEAEAQVEAFISILSKRYGVKEDEIPQFVDAMRWAAQHRSNINSISWHALLGVVGALAVALAVMVWEGIKSTLRR